ncbi:heavy metal response regulator transcription factor [Hahella aquimaris]|uniref:heavy metal response regulator transcription factor n=1 Tax=Hahella sp. HNIBRBA332 TaxID=3015983 RepID=UPI00273A99A2|nr:heavy metal response regulator transcription factor [Hahella sp. HNIBRBA332]WLQ16120.1 heavy metal response regulator transcription factor [Hahella sp. HNIBRBA332]
MKLLVVEDEAKTREYLRKGLTEAGFVVDTAANGLDGRHLAMTEQFDLIVMDIMLPDLDGWRLLASLREGGNATPVLFLTARDSVSDRVQGLESGADDYLVKPFAFSELLARVRNILRRGLAPLSGNQLSVGDLTLDISRRSARRGDADIQLTTKEFTLLELFVRRQGEVLPRSLIASQVWDMNFDSDTNVIDVAVRRLRMKVDDGHEIKLIQTVRGMGYRLDVRNELH